MGLTEKEIVELAAKKAAQVTLETLKQQKKKEETGACAIQGCSWNIFRSLKIMRKNLFSM